MTVNGDRLGSGCRGSLVLAAQLDSSAPGSVSGTSAG